ncbi:MAG: hypothetical protein EOP24_42055 [Hyphomicrobiales bacterium]|nr:MAG: hypothetical protein EOP24_42055 [Hyphomicrobiales bacterium]
MSERESELSVFEYLVLDKAYPRSEIQLEAALSDGPEGKGYRADLAILDSRRSEIIGLIEVKGSREHKALRSAISQLLQYRRILGKPYVPLYLFFPPLPGSGRRFDIAHVLPDGNTKDVFPDEFPNYDALVAADKSGGKATRTANVRSAIDTFRLTCILMSLAVVVIFGLDVAGIVQLTVKPLALAGVAGALLILPFAAKLKMLGVEFERHVPKEPPLEP